MDAALKLAQFKKIASSIGQDRRTRLLTCADWSRAICLGTRAWLYATLLKNIQPPLIEIDYHSPPHRARVHTNQGVRQAI